MAEKAVRFGNKNVGGIVNRMLYPIWEAIPNGDYGERIKLGEYRDATVQITGTFGTGGSISLRGSNLEDPDAGTAAHWFIITDPQGNAITKTAAAGEVNLEAPLWISPIVTAGDGTTAINVFLKATRGP